LPAATTLLTAGVLVLNAGGSGNINTTRY
jgi:hypothetical protein